MTIIEKRSLISFAFTPKEISKKKRKWNAGNGEERKS